jgi:hypothetical protein
MTPDREAIDWRYWRIEAIREEEEIELDDGFILAVDKEIANREEWEIDKAIEEALRHPELEGVDY